MANAKGTVVVEAVKILQERGEQARTALPERVRRYLTEKIVLASWYPLEDYIELLRVMSRIGTAGSGGTPCEQMGRQAARSHMQGTYSRLNKSADRKAAMTLASSMYDSGEFKMVERSPGRAVMELAGFALPSREVCETFTGYQAERMILLGFEDVKVKHTKCRALGAPNCFWELTWKGKGKTEA
jgi:hypothetical protein